MASRYVNHLFASSLVTQFASIMVCARSIRQALSSKTPVLLANRPKHERASADGVVGRPCLQRRVSIAPPFSGKVFHTTIIFCRRRYHLPAGFVSGPNICCWAAHRCFFIYLA